MKWNIKNSSCPKNHAELKQILLENRSVSDEKLWFQPPRPATFSLVDFDINQSELKKALVLLKKAKETNDLVVIFGDYDADGITATAILWRILHQLGFNAKPFIPDRLKHGYGLTTKALEEIFSTTKPGLIITVDNGIVAHEAADYLSAKKIPIIITDHHLPEKTLPKAEAIFHSTKTCGAGVSWLFAREVNRYFSPDNDQLINKQLDLVGIATIADQMPLTDFNRAFAWWGIKSLKLTTRIGLLELMKNANINQNLLDSTTINFALAPRINAMGRLKNGLDALRLLCTSKQSQAEQLATELSLTNVERQDMTSEQIKEALTQVESQSNEKILFISSANFHEGVIGLIAGKITEQFHKPTIVVAIGENSAKASARSIPGINIIEHIRLAKNLLLAAGGHPMAAGFSSDIKNVTKIKTKLQAEAKDFADDLFEKSIVIECILPSSLIDEKSYHLIKTFEPFGIKNTTPCFGFYDLKIVSIKTMGQESKHMKLVVKDTLGQYVTLICWKQGHLASKLNADQTISATGELNLNEWRGRISTQIVVRTIQID